MSFSGLGDSFGLLGSGESSSLLSGVGGVNSLVGGFWDSSAGESGSSTTAGFGHPHPPLTKKYELPDLGKRLEDEIVSDYLTFPSLSKLQQKFNSSLSHLNLNINLFRWATDGKEWVEYALYLPDTVFYALGGQSALQSLASKCRCEVSFRELLLQGQKERLAIISRDAFTGSVSIVLAINHLLDSLFLVLNQLNPSSTTTAISSSSPAATTSLSSNPSSLPHLPPSSSLLLHKDFSVADSVVDSLISPGLTEKDLLSSPSVSSVSSSGLTNPSPLHLSLPASNNNTASPSLNKGKHLRCCCQGWRRRGRSASSLLEELPAPPQQPLHPSTNQPRHNDTRHPGQRHSQQLLNCCRGCCTGCSGRRSEALPGDPLGAHRPGDRPSGQED